MKICKVCKKNAKTGPGEARTGDLGEYLAQETP